MTTLFGRFEIQSELSKSETALIYKAMDLKANQDAKSGAARRAR